MEAPLRCHPNEAVLSGNLRSVTSPYEHLRSSLALLVQECPPATPWPNKFRSGRFRGLFTGPVSIAHLFFHLSRVYPDLNIAGQTSEQWCTQYLLVDEERQSFQPEDDCGITNEYLAYHAVSAAFTKLDEHVQAVIKAAQSIDTAPVNNEYWNGRAGALYLLRLVRAQVPSSKAGVDAAMKPLIEYILSRRPWTSHGKRSLGAVHGIVGIITQIVLSDSSYAGNLKPDLMEILKLQDEHGDWPIRPDSGKTLAQFCHGAPGIIISLQALRQYYPSLQSEVDAAISRGRQAIWERGLLTKEPNLCHGITGNALALEGAQREHFLAIVVPDLVAEGLKDGTFLKGDDPYGLLWGEAGRAWGWAILDAEKKGLDLDGFAAYTDV